MLSTQSNSIKGNLNIRKRQKGSGAMKKKIKLLAAAVLVLSFMCSAGACASVSENKKSKNAFQETPQEAAGSNQDFLVPEVLGQPTDRSIIVNVVPAVNMDICIEYGTAPGQYTGKTDTITAEASAPREILLDNLTQNKRYYYKITYRKTGDEAFLSEPENTFETQRAPGSQFVFDIQGDSHPERQQQFSSELYINTMHNVQADKPDFYFTMGDDFSVDTMNTITEDKVDQLYINQRRYLGLVGSSAPLFLVNGNHEQAAQYVLDGTANNAAVWGQNARNTYFSQPLPGDFYTGDTEDVQYIGKLRDYYAFIWGDALFVVIDPYWHSSIPVDNPIDGDKKRTDMWGITLGDAQYQWFKKTLEESNAKYKFVFSHHVLGTGRGGIELADLYEWGGKDKNGSYQFDEKRPGWELPIQEMMAENNVTIFFQGHDHIFAKEELDGVIYQTLPEPADPNYALYNSDAYKSGVKFPNSGHVRVTVSSEQVKVEYINSVLSNGVRNGETNGEAIYTYTVNPK
jgi:hypothetical protein